MNIDRPDELDRLLEEGLAAYSSEAPRAGLERRVLAHVGADGRGSRFGNWRWMIWVPALAAAIWTAMVIANRPRVAGDFKQVPIARQVPVMPRVAPRRMPELAVKRRVRREVPMVKPALPKREQFPTVDELSPGERALMQLAARFPETARDATAPMEPREAPPIDIPFLEIAPLNSGGQQN
jgi:hypothetical protein